MNIDQVTQLVQSALRGAGFSLFLSADNEFTSTLNIGQIIKGRVLRQYEGNRYAVDFAGHEKVVDSAVPLKTNEIIHGRVVALGDRVELQRVASDGSIIKPSADGASPVTGFNISNRFEKLIQETFARYQGQLTAADQTSLLRSVRSASDPGIMVMAGLVLSKLGLSQAPELLMALYHSLNNKAQNRGMFAHGIMAGEVQSQSNISERPVSEVLSGILTERLQQVPEKEAANSLQNEQDVKLGDSATAGNGGDQSPPGNPQQPFWNAGRLLLNTQSAGSVSHRVATIPFLLGDRLVEVDVALFDQRRHIDAPDGIRHRQIVFSLNLESLGHVEILATVANHRARVVVTTENSEATAYLAGYMTTLKDDLEQIGWAIDELSYETKTEGIGGVNTAVVEHYISQDSLSRLM